MWTTLGHRNTQWPFWLRITTWYVTWYLNSLRNLFFESCSWKPPRRNDALIFWLFEGEKNRRGRVSECLWSCSTKNVLRTLSLEREREWLKGRAGTRNRWWLLMMILSCFLLPGPFTVNDTNRQFDVEQYYYIRLMEWREWSKNELIQSSLQYTSRSCFVFCTELLLSETLGVNRKNWRCCITFIFHM